MFIGNPGAMLPGAMPLALERKDGEDETLTVEIKKSVDDLGKLFETFKAKNDERLTQAEKKGEDAVTKEELEKLNTAIDDGQAALKKQLDEIEANGSAEVSLGGRAFTISRDFVHNAREQSLKEAIHSMRKALLVLHAPGDDTVGIDNASAIFTAARHPKSFISLDKADHLLTKAEDAQFVAAIIAGWVSRYLPADEPQGIEAMEHVRVSETGDGKFQNTVLAGRHRFFADEPQSFGGLDTGPSPYDLLSAALGACTSMTLRLYAEKKKLDLGRVSVDVSHDKIHMADCEACTDEERAGNGRIDQFDRVISVEGGIAAELEDKLIEIAGKCPVHRTLEAGSKVKTSVKTDG